MKRIFGRISLYTLPKRLLTVFVGKLSRHSLSRHLIPMYIRHYKINPNESEYPPNHYASLIAFFSRRLRVGTRTVARVGIASPVDGTVSEFGRIRNGQLLQAKGCSYSLAALVGERQWARMFENGDYITLYLSPKDYHRIHMPTDGTVIQWTYIPGNLYPVNALGVNYIEGLFTKNERLVTIVENPAVKYAVIKIGATIVGSIRTNYGPVYESPLRRHKGEMRTTSVHVPLRRGEELGHFEFGSTVILLFQPGYISDYLIEVGDGVQMGQLLAVTKDVMNTPT